MHVRVCNCSPAVIFFSSLCFKDFVSLGHFICTFWTSHLFQKSTLLLWIGKEITSRMLWRYFSAGKSNVYGVGWGRRGERERGKKVSKYHSRMFVVSEHCSMHYFHAVWLKLVDYLILLLKNKIITQQEITNIPSTFDLFGKKKKEVSWMKKYPFWNSHDNIYTVTWSGGWRGV